MRRFVPLTMLVLSFALLEMGGQRALASQRAASAAPSERLIAVFAGRTLVVPLAGPAGETAQGGWRPDRAPKVEWGSDRAKSELRFFCAPTAGGPAVGWLPRAAEWETSTEAGVRDGAARPGFWAIVLDAPVSERGKPLRVDARAIPTVWLEEPPRSVDAARLPPIEADEESVASLVALLGGSATDPFQRWRTSIALDRFRGEHELPLPANSGVADLALQNELRWRAALAALARDDADLAADLVARITAVVRSPEGTLLPAWSLDEPGLVLLRDDLLDPDSSSARRVERARSWIQTDAGAVAWCVDDAGSLPGAGPYALVGVANIARQPQVVSLAVEGEAAKNPVRLPGHASVALRAFFDAQASGGPIGSAVIARVGGWTRALAVGRDALAPRPPGLVLGPLLAQWDLATWRAGVPVPVIGERAAVALLAPATDLGSWTLYLESRFPPGEPPSREIIRVHLGPREGESRVVEVGPGASGSLPVAFDHDRWRAVVTLPIAADAQMLTLGLERVEDSGRRSSWPRAMMPDQPRGPGRALIDLSAWGGLQRSEP